MPSFTADALKIDEIARSLRVHLEVRTARHVDAIEETAEVVRTSLVGWRDRLVAELEEELVAFDDGCPPTFVRVAGQSHLEKPLNRLLAWMADPEEDHGWGRQFLILLARVVRLPEMVADLEAGSAVELFAEQSIDGDYSGKEPDLIVGTPRAALMLENKLWSPESGDQYGPYLESFQSWANGRKAKCFLCVPIAREIPPGWDGCLLHQDLASLLMEIADGTQPAPVWTRISASICAVTFQGIGHSQTIREANLLLECAKNSEATLEILSRLRATLPLPRPITPWKQCP